MEYSTLWLVLHNYPDIIQLTFDGKHWLGLRGLFPQVHDSIEVSQMAIRCFNGPLGIGGHDREDIPLSLDCFSFCLTDGLKTTGAMDGTQFEYLGWESLDVGVVEICGILLIKVQGLLHNLVFIVQHHGSGLVCWQKRHPFYGTTEISKTLGKGFNSLLLALVETLF